MFDQCDGNLPLEGVTVIDVTQVIAGPFASMTLGDLGADVIKIESPDTGDISRGWQPRPYYFDTLNRNKRSVAVDLSDETGQEVVLSLVEEADVIIESMKPGAMERFNLSYEAITKANPDIIYCSVSGFGSDSPYEGLPAWDIIVQAMSGTMSITGEKDGEPLWCGLPIGDLVASLFAVNSVIVSLFARESGGISSEQIEVPMMDSLISLLTARAGHTFGTGEPFPRTGSQHPTSAPFGVYNTKDDSIVVAAGSQGLWPSFCRSIGEPNLIDDPRFETQDDRLENRETLRGILEEKLQQRSTEEWLEIMHAESVPAAKINDTKTVWEDEHVKHRELKRKLPREGREDATVIGHPVRYRNQGTQMTFSPPELGEHTRNVLQDLGMTDPEIDELYERGVIK